MYTLEEEVLTRNSMPRVLHVHFATPRWKNEGSHEQFLQPY